MTQSADQRIRRGGTLGAGCALAILVGTLVPMTFAAAEGPRRTVDVNSATERARMRFAALDADGDGEISAAEMAAAPPPPRWQGDGRGPGRRGPKVDDELRAELEDEVFERLDQDGSGALERNEFGRQQLRDATRAAVMAERLKRLDSDGNGSVSEAEFLARIAELDADGDGELEPGEWRPQGKGN